LWTKIWECGSGVLRRSSWGVRRGGIFAVFFSINKKERGVWKEGFEGGRR
jgi:hypothetical protein